MKIKSIATVSSHYSKNHSYYCNVKILKNIFNILMIINQIWIKVFILQ